MDKPIEIAYEGAGKMRYQNKEFVVCLIRDAKDIVEAYYKGNALESAGGRMCFRLPVIEVGTMPNFDGFYPLQQLKCVYQGGTIRVEDAHSFDNVDQHYFYDVENGEILELNGDNGLLGVNLKDMETIGQRTQNRYVCVLRSGGLWKFMMESDESDEQE